MQSHPGSLAAQCRTLTTHPPGNPNLCCPGLLSAAWAAGAGGGRKGGWEMLSPSVWECSLCERKHDPKGGMMLCLDGCWEGLPFLPAKSCVWLFGDVFPGGASLRNHWALPPELHLVDTSKTWSCQLSLGNAALFAWRSSCGGAEPSSSFRELGRPLKRPERIKKKNVQWEK